MADEALAPSDGANETSVVETTNVQAQDSGASTDQQSQQQAQPEKPVSTRQALEKAFKQFDEPAAKTADNRDPKTGQFTQKAKDAEATKPADRAAAPVAPVQEQTTAPAQIKPAPSRMSKEAQAAWAQVPEVVRNEVERGYAELQNGIEKYKAAFEPIKQFDEMARNSGTTLDKALTSYVGIENLLRKDVLAGMREVCRNIGVDPAKVGAALAEGQQPQGGDTIEVTQLKQQLAGALQEIKGLKEQFTGFTQSSQDAQLKAEVDAFKKDKPYFDEIAPVAAKLLSGGLANDLASAYDMAVRLTPEIAAKIEAAKAAAAQGTQPANAQPKPKPAEVAHTGKAKLSISGSPSSGSDPATRKPAGSTREALANAFANAGL